MVGIAGGGIDNDETYLEAALREFREEVGIVVAAAQVGPPLWCRSASFRYRGRRRLQQEVIVRIAIEARKPAIGYAERLDYEIEDHFDYRWWSVADIQKSKERFYPGKLPVLLSPFLTGAKIDEPFELWS
ncbi:NUDIX domain-containing protein [Bosea vestrisii]|uniref:NUDIX domain-containing protein n=1 Tax=Bosea vestrisii TaxID=151416 RepID=UPI003264BC74